MKIQINIDTEKDGQDAVTSALNGYKFRGVLFDILHNKRKEIVEWRFEDQGKPAQAEGAQAVFDAIWEELESWGIDGLIKNENV